MSSTPTHRRRSRVAAFVTALAAWGAAAASAPLRAQEKKPVTPDDYGKWENVGTARLSPFGDWLAVPISRVNEQNELRVRSTASDSVVVLPFAERPVFSPDGHRLAYAIGSSPEEREALEKDEKPLRKDLGILDLTEGTVTTVEAVESFAFSASGRYLLMRRYAAQDAPDGSADVVVRDLQTGTDVPFGNVAEYAWRDGGDLLALTIRARGDVGNAVQLWDPATGSLRVLDARPTRYSHPTWRDDSSDLVVLRAFTDETREDSSQVVLAWRGLEDGGRRFELDPVGSDDVGPDSRVVSYRSPVWSDDGSAVFVGLKEWKATEEPEEGEEDQDEDQDEDRPEVQVWNSRDRRIMPEQKRDATRDEQRNVLAVWRLDDGRVVRLTDGSLERERVAAGGKLVTAVATEPYAFERMFGRNREDVYAVDVDSGERVRAARGVPFSFGASPEGRYVLSFVGGHYHAYDVKAREDLVLSEAAPTTFANVDYDHPVTEKPPYGVAGWTEGDRSVLVYDKYDVWELTPRGEPRRLTHGAESQIVYRYVDLDRDEPAVDLSADVYLSMTGEWTLHYGYARLRDGRVQELVYLDDHVSRLARADSADAFTYLVQDFDDSPDYFVAGGDFARPRQVTETNPFQADYAWGHSELVEYANAHGRRLQGALFYPADYDPARKYPMITYIYEIRSWSAKRYSVPSERSYYNPAVWTANGYFVWEPDIVFDPRDPGVSSARTLEASIAAVAEKGVIDPERVGLVGHSWGGYQAAFVVTATDVFAAAVAGAPLTDLVSMYGSVFWVANAPETGHFEVGQERMDVPLWKDPEAYMRNSAVFNVEKLNTPLMVEIADADRNVNWGQGLEYYNAARRAGKDLVLLVYHGEGHGLRKKPNQIDYQRRILRWFGHFLKGEEAPRWITEPVPYLEQRGKGSI